MARLAVFDMNETTLDLAPVRSEINRQLGHSGAAGMWFARLLGLSMAITATGHYKSFTQLARAAMGSVADSVAGFDSISDEDWQLVVDAILTLPPHPDVADGLDRLIADGWRLFALTNSTQAAVEAQLTSGGITDRFEAIVSVEAVQTFKPSPAPYHHIADVADVEPSDMWMVAAHDWDLAGAKAVGMKTAFVSRPGARFLDVFPPADVTATDFADLATQLADLA